MTKTASKRQVKHVDHLCFISDKPPWKLIFFHQPRSSLRIPSFCSPSIKIHLLHTNHQTTWSTRSLLHLRIKIHHQTTYYSWSHATRNNHNRGKSIMSDEGIFLYGAIKKLLRIQQKYIWYYSCITKVAYS